MEKKHILSALVNNQPGVLVRIAGLISRRGYNIDSLTVCATENPEHSRMTIVVIGDDDIIEQILRQLRKLEDVKVITRIDKDKAIHSELLIVKVQAVQDNRAALLKTSQTYNGKILDIGKNTITLEVTGQSEELDEFIDHIKKYKILEMARTGITALESGDNLIVNHLNNGS